VLEVDYGQLDQTYARLDSDNTFAGTQRAPTFIAEHVDESPSIQGRNFAAGFGVGVLGESTGENGVALYGTSYAASGGTLGVRAEVWSPDGIAGSFHNAGDGRLLEASTPTHGQVMTLEANGLFNVRQVNATSNFVPGEGEQIFVIDALATATSGHTRGVNATTFSPQSSAVVGSAQATEGGNGGAFDSYGENGLGVWAAASATTGGGVGIHAEAWSPGGVAGRFYNYGDGQILSGGNSTGEVFRVEGDGTVYAHQYLTTSSRRWKENVHELENALDQVTRLRGVSFDWKADGRADIGLIAEEVAEVVPQVVGVDEEGATGVDYSRLTALLVQAVKEQQGVIGELRAEIEALRAEIRVAGN